MYFKAKFSGVIMMNLAFYLLYRLTVVFSSSRYVQGELLRLVHQ